MKLLIIFIFTVLVVQTSGEKTQFKRSKQQHQSVRRLPRPANQKRGVYKEKGLGWGWNGPINFETTSCVDPGVLTDLAYDIDFFGKWRVWYWTGDTKYNYNLLARILLGRLAQNQEELNQMCPSQISSLLHNPLTTNGYGVQFDQTCYTSTTSSSFECPINTDSLTYDASLGVDIFAGFVNQMDYLVGTDNQTYAIFYFCNDGLYGTLQLLTTRPYASPEAVAAFVDLAKTFRIPQSQLQLPQCNTPFSGPYPFPFQNYPNGWSNNPTGWQQDPSNGWNQSPSSNGWSANHSQPSGWKNSNGPSPVEKSTSMNTNSEKSTQQKH